MTVLKYKAQFGRARVPVPKPPTRLARLIALATLVDRWLETGVVANYSDAARRLGITRARMSQIMDLLLLPVGEIEAVLLGESDAAERGMRRG